MRFPSSAEKDHKNKSFGPYSGGEANQGEKTMLLPLGREGSWRVGGDQTVIIHEVTLETQSVASLGVGVVWRPTEAS